MVTFLLTSVLILGLVAIAIYFWQKPGNSSQPAEMSLPQPPAPRGLFSNYQPAQLTAKTENQFQPKNELPDNKALAEKCIEDWQESPDRNSTAKMLHMAALSDDADTYRRAVEIVLQSWHEGKLQDVSAIELQSLFNGEFWLLSSATRSSGAGFVLKRTLSTTNRELESTNNP